MRGCRELQSALEYARRPQDAGQATQALATRRLGSSIENRESRVVVVQWLVVRTSGLPASLAARL